MPYINIKVTNEGVTQEQKRALIQGATQLMVDVLGKNPETTFVVIDEVETDNWGLAIVASHKFVGRRASGLVAKQL